MIAHPIRTFGHRRREGDNGVEIARMEDGKIRMRNRNGEVVYLPLAAISADAPIEIQRTALRDFAGLTAEEIGSVGGEFESLRAVVERIWQSHSFDTDLIGAWLRSRNRGLAYERPLDSLRDGRLKDVMFCAECFIALSPAPYPDRSRQSPPMPQPT